MWRKVIFFIFILSWAIDASCDDSFQVVPPGKLGRAMRDANRRRKPPEAAAKPGPGKIVGKCSMPAGFGAMADEPCVDILLILNDTSGNEVVRTRTDKAGNFLFEASDKTPYKIASGSKFLEIVAPKEPIQAGQTIELKLKSK